MKECLIEGDGGRAMRREQSRRQGLSAEEAETEAGRGMVYASVRLLAAYMPVCRACRLDPVAAVRSE